MNATPLFIVILLSLAMPPTQAQTSLEDAYLAILSAHQSGADISTLIDQLNQAITLLEVGDPTSETQAQELLNTIINEASMLQGTAIQEERIEAAIAIVKVAFLLGLAYLVWDRGDNWFWRAWLRTKRGYHLE